MTDDKTRALIAEAREALRRCAFDSGADHAKLHDALDALEALTVPDGDDGSPWTRHGHLLPGRTPDENRPPVARCGGPKLCRQCSIEAGNLHAHESARATNTAQPVRDALAECLFIANAGRDGAAPTDEQWRQYRGGRSFGYRKMAAAILAAFPVLSRDIAGEIEAEIKGEKCCSPNDFHAEYVDGLRRAAEIARRGR